MITTLDWKAQKLGEKYIEAGAWLPNLPASTYYQAIRQRGLGRGRRLDGTPARLNLRNGALVATGLPHR